LNQIENCWASSVPQKWLTQPCFDPQNECYFCLVAIVIMNYLDVKHTDSIPPCYMSEPRCLIWAIFVSSRAYFGPGFTISVFLQMIQEIIFGSYVKEPG